ncbi:MAG: hypothetical protein ACYTG2_15210 [Planctomycetota bacterium]
MSAARRARDAAFQGLRVRFGRFVPLALLGLAAVLAACTGPLLDEPAKVRRTQVFLPPLLTYNRSDDGTSHDWSALLWLVGHERESERTHTRILPFWWQDDEPPYSSNTLLFPLYYERESPVETTRFFSLLYGTQDFGDLQRQYVIPPLFYHEASRSADYHRSGLLIVYDWKHQDGRDDVVLLSLFGLATVLRVERGLPADGETVPALGRSGSRRVEVGNVLGLVSLFGYDDVGDRREIRLLTPFSSEILSPIRSWRGRGDDPFVREWVFPVYMNAQDEDAGWYAVGPLWGGWHDDVASTSTTWFLGGLLARSTAPDGNTWSVLGLPVVGP